MSDNYGYSDDFKMTTCLKLGIFLFDSRPFMKDLGHIVSENLTWSEYVKDRVEKSLEAPYAIKWNLVNTNLSNKKNAYRSYIVPIFSYCLQLWRLSKSDVNLIESLRKQLHGFLVHKNSNHAIIVQ